MNKLHYLIPLLLSAIACGVQSIPNVANIVNATPTAVTQANPQEIAGAQDGFIAFVGRIATLTTIENRNA